MILVKVPKSDGTPCSEHFLVDTAADRTAFSAELLNDLQLPANLSPSGIALQGIGGASPHVVIRTALEFTRDDGGPARVRGEFAAFTDPKASDMSILGRDVLYNFNVITSRRCNALLLLAGNHRYRIAAG